MNYEDFVKSYTDGDDVPMAVGVMAIPGEDPKIPRLIFPSIFVDYAFSKKQEVSDAYTDKFEKMWEKNDLDGGFEIRRTGDEQVYVAAKNKTFVRALEGGHTKDFSGPLFFAEVNGEKDAINKFFELKEKTTFWVIHFRTTAFSYMLVVDHATGGIVTKEKVKPLKIYEREGGAS